jgi:3',5'-cyclic AMP phosphodiesterase CpdA
MTTRALSAVFCAALLAVTRLTAAPQTVQPVGGDASLTFAVIGDNGTGKKPQYQVGEQMAATHARFPFELVIMLGDNLYGRQKPKDYVDKFERPYAAILKAGVRFFAALGNHDDPNSRFYQGFNMGGARYYTFVRNGVRFLVLDTNLMNPAQLTWLERVLQESTEEWKVAYFHHPLYSSAGRHGSQLELRVTLEPLLVRYGVNVVFSGHDHTYERFKPQKGITYFVAGSGGQLRRADVSASDATAASFDRDQAFMVVEIAGDDMRFQAITRTGRVVDSGVIHRRASAEDSP